MSIKITSDSTCDLSPELISRYQVEILPLTIVKDGAPYRDGLEITPDDIFRHVDAGGNITSTTAVSVGEYRDVFARLSPAHDAVIHINISAEFSSCYQNACIAAQEFNNVYVMDSRNLSTGHGLVVIEAALAAQRGMAPEEIISYLKELTGRVEASFILNRLDYMVKGGRCSAVTMLGANLLRLKPCIEVKDGKMGVAKKYRGSFEKCVLEYVKDRLQGRTDLELDRIFITYSTAPQGTVEQVRTAITEYAPFKEILVTRAGCTVSTHCGPNTLGILFIRKK
ncbi:DegV family protein [uncultured Pseudoflavonifractor sp.]|uniref:DegV family protein n=1 Tax=uncultured Pseudoflavonifractor sp. TaxID=1221379 RepID=UPI0025DD1036|nr:DegV family protein [uncultured Pseudoflavonifractor sp.]